MVLAATAYYAGELERHRPLEDWFIWRLLPLWGYALLFAVSCLAFGAALLRWTTGDRRLPRLEWILQAFTVGLVAFVGGLYLLGATGLFATWSALALPGILLAASAPTLPATWREFAAAQRRDVCAPPSRRAAIALVTAWGVVCLAFVYLEALHPSAINFDAAWYHIPIAQDYARIGRIVPFPGEEHRAYPHLTSMVQTWALLVPGLDTPERWMLILHLEFVLVLGRILGVAAVAAFLLDDREVPALWVAFFLFPSIFIYDQNIGGAADHYLGFFAAPLFVALGRSLVRFQLQHCVLASVALGGAMLTKYQSVYLAIAATALWAGAWLWHVGRQLSGRWRPRLRAVALGWRRLLLAPLVIVAVTGAVSAPHFVKNVVFYGNPLYPLAHQYFPTSHPHHERRAYLKAHMRREFRVPGAGLERQLDLAKRAIRYPFDTGNRTLTGNAPYMGALFVLLLPTLLFVRNRRRPLLAVAFASVAFYVWAATGTNDRYLLTFLGVPMGVAAALLVRGWGLGWWARAGLVALVGLELCWGGDAALTYGGKRLERTMDLLRSRKPPAERLAGERRTERAITAATPPHARILARNYRSLLGLDREVYSDVETAQSLLVYAGLRNAHELHAQCVRAGITHLLYPEGQRRPHAWHATILFAELARHGTHRQRIGGVVVVELPRQPPPATVPYHVLVSGVREYGDGLYRVEELDILDQTEPRTRPRRQPHPALTTTNARPLLGRSAAVVVGARALPASAAAALAADFERVERFAGFSVYLRRRP